MISSLVPSTKRSRAFLADENDVPSRKKLQEHQAVASHFTAAYASEHSSFEEAVAEDRMTLGGHMV